MLFYSFPDMGSRNVVYHGMSNNIKYHWHIDVHWYIIFKTIFFITTKGEHPQLEPKYPGADQAPRPFVQSDSSASLVAEAWGNEDLDLPYETGRRDILKRLGNPASH